MYAKFAIFKLFWSVVGRSMVVVGNTLISKPASFAKIGNMIEIVLITLR